MTGRILLMLPRDPEASTPWIRIGADGLVARRGELAPNEDLVTPEGDHIVTAVPGEDVTILWRDLPADSIEQARAAAVLTLEGESALSSDAMHVAVTHPALPDGRRALAIVDANVMAGWTERLAAHGLDPDVISPTSLMLPLPADGALTAQRGLIWDVRGHDIAFSSEADMIDMLVDPATLIRIDDPSEIESLRLAESEAPILNLRQGRFRHAGPRAAPGLVKRMSLLAAAAVLLFVMATGVTAWRQDRAAAALEVQTAQLAEDAGVTVDGDPLPALRLAMAERIAGAGFQPAAAALFAAVRSAPGTSVRELDWNSERLAATIAFPRSSSAEALRPGIEGAGFAYRAGPARGRESDRTADIEVALP
ncbi:MAG: type II secretion system protein GspL [Pacificimonas sp.]